MTNVIIVHGANEDEKSAYEGGRENTRHWHPWLKQQLEEKGIEVSGELYPRDWEPDYEEWKELFEKNQIDEETTLVGHSLGCAFILRWLSETKKKVKKVILVAPYVLKTTELPLLDQMVNFKLDKNLDQYNNSLIIIYSENDYPFILKSIECLKSNLKAKFIKYTDAGHFCTGNGFKEFPELLEEILK